MMLHTCMWAGHDTMPDNYYWSLDGPDTCIT